MLSCMINVIIAISLANPYRQGHALRLYVMQALLSVMIASMCHACLMNDSELMIDRPGAR